MRNSRGKRPGSWKPSWRKIINFISSPAQEYPPLGMTAVKEVSPSSMLNTRSSSSNPIRLTEQSALGSTSPAHEPAYARKRGLQGRDRAGSAWGSERGRASPCAGLGIRSSHWAVIRGSGVRICSASITLGYTLIPSPCSCGIPRACRSIRGSRGSAWR